MFSNNGKFALLFSVTLIAAAGVVGVVSATEPGSPGSKVSILQRASRADDRLPDAVMAGTAGEVGVEASSARVLGDYAGQRYWVAPASDDQLCLISFTEATQGTGLICNPRRDLEVGMWLGSIDDAGNHVVAVLVPDGFTSVRATPSEGVAGATPVEDNHAFVTFQDGGDIRLEGKDTADALVHVPAPPSTPDVPGAANTP